jgi:hypothetical protein
MTMTPIKEHGWIGEVQFLPRGKIGFCVELSSVRRGAAGKPMSFWPKDLKILQAEA